MTNTETETAVEIRTYSYWGTITNGGQTVIDVTGLVEVRVDRSAVYTSFLEAKREWLRAFIRDNPSVKLSQPELIIKDLTRLD